MARRATARYLIVALLVSLSSLLVTTTALARWNVHNSADVTQMTAPVGGTEDQTCTNRLRGETGWSTSTEDPSAFVPPQEAYTPTTYEVWKAPAGTSFAGAQQEFDNNGNRTAVIFTDANGQEIRVEEPILTFDTAPRTAVAQPIQIDPPDGTLYVFTTAPISQSLLGLVAPGDVIGLIPPGGASFLPLTAVYCEPLLVSGTKFSAVKGSTFTATVAKFTGPGGTADYSASISWGDGTSSAGTIRSTASGFVVKGTHRYRAVGTYSVRVFITQVSTGVTKRAFSTATVRHQ